MLTYLASLMPTLSLFHSSIHYGKNVLLKNFALDWTGLIIEVDDDLNG